MNKLLKFLVGQSPPRKLPKRNQQPQRWQAKGSKEQRRGSEDFMELAITAIAIIAGMAFSLTVALLVEELIFGKVFRLIFARQSVAVKSGRVRRCAKRRTHAVLEIFAHVERHCDDGHRCR